MSSIPGAHASLGFGRKRVDFYASPGVTAGEGNRRGEHEIRDADGGSHSMRLSRPDTPLETGETVTVLRAQSGPEHESRPVAVINHDRNAWTRTAPEATAVLARSGITRATNWWLAMILFMVAAITFAWPDIRLFMLEVDPGIFASLPDFNIFAFIAAQIPALQGFDLASVIPGFNGIFGQIGLPGWLSVQALAFVIPLTFVALITYFARSWRIIWAPVFVFAAIATGLALGTESPLTPAMLTLAGVALIFCLGGFINRTRDAGRFESRISRLSENILRHPPAETVAAPAATMVAAGAVLEEVSDEDVAEDDLPSDDELAAARVDTVDADDADPAPVPSMQSPSEDLGVEDTSDRDMVMPPPPPLANRAVSETGESGDAAAEPNSSDAAILPVGAAIATTAAASAMHAPTPAPAPAADDAQTDDPVHAEAPIAIEPETTDVAATATASAMQAPTPALDVEVEPDLAPIPEPEAETPAAEEVHAFVSPDAGPGETLMSSSDIVDVEDVADATDAGDAVEAAPIVPPTLQNSTSDEVADPFMTETAEAAADATPTTSDDSETPRQTDS